MMSLLVFYIIGSLIVLLGNIYRLYKHPDEDVTLSDLMFITYGIIFSWVFILSYILVEVGTNENLVVYRRKGNKNNKKEEQSMIQEEYVSLETAKLLKARGFNGEFHKHYWGYKPGKEFLTEDSFDQEYDYPAPTQQVAMRWLREVKDLAVMPITSVLSFARGRWFCSIESVKGYDHFQFTDSFATYEEACEGGIKHCLKNLIK